MKIHIPTPLRAYTNRQETVDVTGTTVAAGLQSLVDAYPALQKHLFTPEGKLRSFVNVYVRDEDVRYLPEKEQTPVAEADEVTIIPSIAGGSGPSILELLRESVRMVEAVPNPTEEFEPWASSRDLSTARIPAR